MSLGRVLAFCLDARPSLDETHRDTWTNDRCAKIASMNATNETSIDLSSLRSGLAEPVVAPGDEGYDEARQAWALLADPRPAAVAFPTGPVEVAAAVRFARANGLRVALQATGHGASPLESLEHALLVKTTHMTGLEIDPAGRRARAEAGVLWGDVVAAAGAEGLACLHGSSPDTGVIGYTLGGGIGWYSRRYGLASNSVLAIEAVTAEGELVRCDAETEPDLFWALRGGGGAFAAVTALEFSLYPVGDVYAGWLVFEAADSRAALHAYRDWAAAAPDEVTTSFRLLHLPPLPEVPEPLRDRPVVAIDGVFMGTEAEAARLLAPLRECAPLVMDTFATMPAAELGPLHGDPEQPVPSIGDGVLVRDLTPEAVDALIDVGGPGSGSPLLFARAAPRSAEPWHAPARAPERWPRSTPSSCSTRSACRWPTGWPRPSEATSNASRRRLRHGAAGATSTSATPRATARSHSTRRTWARLREVKSRYDADDLFCSNHPVPPAG